MLATLRLCTHSVMAEPCRHVNIHRQIAENPDTFIFIKAVAECGCGQATPHRDFPCSIIPCPTHMGKLQQLEQERSALIQRQMKERDRAHRAITNYKASLLQLPMRPPESQLFVEKDECPGCATVFPPTLDDHKHSDES